MTDDKIKFLSELVRKAESYITYDRNYEYELEDINNNKETLFKKHPKCFLMLKKKDGELIPFFPLCNKSGLYDPKVIEFSLKISKTVSNTLNENEIDYDHLDKTIKRLKILYTKYSREIPKDGRMAYKKGKITRYVNKLNK